MKKNGIPEFLCKEGCHKCCGVVPFSAEEMERVRPVWKEIEWIDIDVGFLPHRIASPMIEEGNLDCPFLGDNGCLIYERRPLMCRIFGTVDSPMMICPEGMGPKKMLTEDEVRHLLKKYRKQDRRDRNGLTHQTGESAC